MSKLYWLVLSRKQKNISAASSFHFALFQSPSHLTLGELPVKCCSAHTRYGMEEDNLLVFSPMLLLPEQHQTQAYRQTEKLQKFSQLTESVET